MKQTRGKIIIPKKNHGPMQLDISSHMSTIPMIVEQDPSRKIIKILHDPWFHEKKKSNSIFIKPYEHTKNCNEKCYHCTKMTSPFKSF